MAKAKVLLYGALNKIAVIDTRATQGADIGVDLRYGGAVQTLAQLQALFGGAAGASIRSGYGIAITNGSPQTINVNRDAVFAWRAQHSWEVPLWAPGGTAALPSVTFTSDPNTGAYRVGADNYGVTTGGTLRWDVNTARVAQSLPLIITNNSGLRVDNTSEAEAGVEIITFGTASPNGVGNQLAFWERGSKLYGFRIRHTGDAVAEGNLDWYRHDNDGTGVLFMQMTRQSSQVAFADGTAAAPTLSFLSDLDTGFYRGATNNIYVSTGGTQRWIFGISRNVSTLPMHGQDGTAAAPAYGFDADQDTGLYSVGANQLGATVGGTLRLTISTTLFTATLPWVGPAGSAGAPTFSFSGDSNTGAYNVAANRLGFATAGALRYEVGAAGEWGIGGATYGTAGHAFRSGGSGAAPTWGVLAEVGGGTNQSTYAAGDMLYASATDALSKRAIGGTDDLLTVVAGIPTWRRRRLVASTVAGLPGTPIQGDDALVTDALAPAFGAAVVAGGAVVIPVFYDGAAWIVG